MRELKNQKLRSGAERLAAWLLGQSAAANATSFTIPFEKRVLASLLGMTPENLSRAFATLATYGVTTSGRSVSLEDVPGLRGLARPQHMLDRWIDHSQAL